MITLVQRFELLARARRFHDAVQCPGHAFTDEHPDRTKRLRAGELYCTVCGVSVTTREAFFYENGRRHGEDAARSAARNR